MEETSRDPSKTGGKCVICYGDLVGIGGSCGSGEGLLEQVLQSYFVLRHVLEVPVDKVEELLTRRSEQDKVESWIRLCGGCAYRVGECRQVYGEMVAITRKFEGMRRAMIRKVVEGTGGIGMGEEEWRDLEDVTEWSRQFVWRKYQKEFGEFRENEGVSKSPSPVNSLEGVGVEDEEIVGVGGDVVVKEEIESEEEQEDKVGGTLEELRLKLRSAGRGRRTLAEGSGSLKNEPDYPGKYAKKFYCDIEGCLDKDKRMQLQPFISHYFHHKELIFKCSQCPHLSSTATGINSHWRRKHKQLANSVPKSEQYTEQVPVYPWIPSWCPQCPDVLYSSEDSRNAHLQSDHASMEDLQPEGFPHACTNCSKKYPSILELKLHQGIHHSDRDSETIKCLKCNETFRKSTQLIDHRIEVHGMNPTCSKCQKVFKNRYCLTQHQKICSLQQCDQCQESFPTEHKLLVHKRRVHRLDILKCPECDKKFSNSSCLSKHIRTIHKDNPQHFPCQECKKVFRTKPCLSAHIARIHTKETCPCSICQESVPKLRLKQHMFQKHDIGSGTKYPCPDCGKVYFRKSRLAVHTQQKHSSTPEFNCAHCGKQFFSRNSLKRHEKFVHLRKKEYQCKFCSRKFSRMDNLRKHETLHSNNPNQAICLYCEECKKMFRFEHTLNKHKRRKHGPPKVSKPKQKRPQSKPKPKPVFTPGICHLCGKTLKNKYKLRDHIKQVHEKVESAKWFCEHCGKELSSKGGLKVHHALVHKIGWSKHHQTRIPCPMEGCGRKMPSPRLLELHMTQHSGNPQFKCDQCGKGFYFRSNLRRHLITVHSENKEVKSHKCKVCGKGFACGSYLWQHMKTHKQTEPKN